jgi:peptidoglycan hydrolase-like protein with peptidoglycan-binding domain
MPDDIDISAAEVAPELRQGDHGPWVRYLKQMLEHNGLNAGRIDENFDATTESAVRQFQQRYADDGAVTGIADRRTWLSLHGRADSLEQIDDVRGEQVMGQSRLDALQRDGQELDVGAEVGRRGWIQADLNLSVYDHNETEVPYAAAYLRLMDKDTEEWADESGVIESGRFHLDDVWMPRSGWLHLYVDSSQPFHDGNEVGQIVGHASFECNSKTVVFEARQASGVTKTVTVAEARTHGWSKSWTLESGGAIDWLAGGASIGGEQTDEHTDETGREWSFAFPGRGWKKFEQL